MPNNVWNELLGRIETKVNRHSYNTWFSATALVEDAGDHVVVRVPNELCRNWLTTHYTDTIAEAMAEIRRGGVKVAFVLGAGAAAGNGEYRPTPIPGVAAPGGAGAHLSTPTPGVPVSGGFAPGAPVAGPATRDDNGGLSPRFTFDSFVVGASNQFAHAAAVAVGEAPAFSYNPLYLYGGVGLGKTHLMHAIGHYLLEQSPGTSLTYISSERFMNEMITALREDRILDFRARYRKLDVLMVDDVQFLSGREGTQTEFFHTFNALYDAQKQIVISSDCPPHEIRQLEERLRSRFEWGLMADIQTPDTETKVAILQKKAEIEMVPLPDDVALYIADGIKSNVRELEGSLTRLIAQASMTGSTISLPFAQNVLRNVIRRDDRPPVTIGRIQKAVADHFRLKIADLKGRDNSRPVVRPRQIAMFLCRTLTTASLQTIGKAFGDRDHSTVSHSFDVVEKRCQTDHEFHNVINNFISTFR